MKFLLAIVLVALIIFSGCLQSPVKPVYNCPETGCDENITARLAACEDAIFNRASKTGVIQVDQTNNGNTCGMSWVVEKNTNKDLEGLSMECEVPMDIVKSQKNLGIENLYSYCTGSLKDFLQKLQN
jgi:hypothetical protein